jgi:uncharacterized protein (DUF2267 family)
LHALRDRIQKEKAVQLTAQLPLLIKVVFYDGWTHRDKPEKFDKIQFAEVYPGVVP